MVFVDGNLFTHDCSLDIFQAHHRLELGGTRTTYLSLITQLACGLFFTCLSLVRVVFIG